MPPYPLDRPALQRRHSRRALTCAGAAVLALMLSACQSTPVPNTGERSVVGAPAGGSGGSGGGSGGGRATGTASGGAGGGLSTLQSPAAPSANGTPSMPEDGSEPNPAPSQSAVSATGFTLAEHGTAPASGPSSEGSSQQASPHDSEMPDSTDPEGAPNGDEARPSDTHAGEQGGAEAVQITGETGQIASDTAQTSGEAGDAEGNSGEPGQIANVDDPDGAGLADAGGNEPSGDEGGQNGGAAPPVESGATVSNGPMSMTGSRAAIQDRLDASFAVIDGLSLAERERVQRARNAAGLAARGANGIGAGNADNAQEGGGGNGRGERPATLVANNAGTGGSNLPAGASGRLGSFDDASAGLTYPIPVDIPSGDDDDVVARQLREAALHEADPELREKLWDEYRAYTGLNR